MVYTDSRGNEVQLPDNVVPSWRIAAYAIIESHGKYLMVQSGSGHWVFPGGGVEQDETIPEAAVRECGEETGYTITLSDEKPFCLREQPFYHSREDRFYHSVQIFYRATLTKDTTDPNLLGEHDKTRLSKWIELDELSDQNIHTSIQGIVDNLRLTSL